MVELWYALVAIVFAIYVVLDGFDFGAGILAPWVAKTDTERRQVLAAIGPYWDGNEVWLLAGGGALFVAFPGALAAGISGFYFAIFLLLWCLIGRGLSIEFRSHVGDPLWRSVWDAAFWLTSTLLALFFGVALGNLVRGLPIGGDGWFSLALFTSFTPTDPVGILDWYTLLAGAFAVVALAAHGAAFLAWKTDGPVALRSRVLHRRVLIATIVLWPIVTVVTGSINRELFVALSTRPLALGATALAVVGLMSGLVARGRGNDRAAFAASSAFLFGILGATAASLFPVLLRARGGPELSITAFQAANDAHGLTVALRWFAVGLPLALFYLGVVTWLHRGRAQAAPEGEGY
jgi:cytochrome bd ubiquinol oxidase subunit II